MYVGWVQMGEKKKGRALEAQAVIRYEVRNSVVTAAGVEMTG